MRLEGRRPAIGLYYFTGTLLVASGLCTWIVSGFHRHLVRLQWRIFAVSIIMYGATYLISATEILGFIPIVDSVFTMNMLSSASLAAGLLSVTACGGETTAWMRLLDTFTAEIVCWMFFLAIHSNDATGFSKYHLLFSVFALAFTAAIALAATQGATSRAESLFAACATVYFSARAITAFVINIVAYYWLQTKGETLFNLLFPVPSLALIVATLYVRERYAGRAPTGVRTPNLAMRSVIPSLMSMVAVMLALAIAGTHLISACIAIAVVTTCFIARTQLLHREMLRRNTTLASRVSMFEELAHRDTLTGVSNRRGLEEALQQANRNRASQPVALLLIDLDHFKAINDTYGHHAGDGVLAGIAAVLANRCARIKDACVARIGGDEFTAFLPGITHDEAMRLADLIRCDVEKLHCDDVHSAVSVSIGVSVRLAGKLLLLELMRDADSALYRAKAAGRNVAEFGGPLSLPSGASGPHRIA